MELRTQGSKPRTALPRKDPLEAKDRNAEGLEHKCKCSPKKSLQKFFSGNLNKKGLQKFFSGVLSKKHLLKFFFRRPTKFQQFKKKFCPWAEDRAIFEDLKPKPRTSKCVLKAKDVLEDSTSVNRHLLHISTSFKEKKVRKRATR